MRKIGREPALVRAALAGMLLQAGSAGAVAIHVPADYPSIQEGLTAASAGDTVLVACGTYFEHDIVMRPGAVLRGETGDPDCVIIDARRQGRVIYNSVSNFSTHIEGLTLQNGLSGLGGGMRSISGTLRDLVVRDCQSTSDGGGLSLSGTALQRVVCQRNQAASMGGGICSDIQATWLDVVCVGNSAPQGSAIYSTMAYPQHFPRVDGLTVVGNVSPPGGSAVYSHWDDPEEWCPTPVISRAIVAFNVGIGLRHDGFYHPEDFDPYVSCSIVYGNSGGNYAGDLWDHTLWFGNRAVDPLLCDIDAGDYRPAPGSPCLPENNYCLDLIGALPAGCDLTGAPADGEAQTAFTLLRQNFPNPFNATTTVSFVLAEPANVTLSIYDLAGRKIATLLDSRRLAAGLHEEVWRGLDSDGRRVASGVYFSRLEAGDLKAEGKLILLK